MMECTALGQFLRSLCCNSPWKYAVLWKLRHQKPMILQWEGGYCIYPRLSNNREATPGLSSSCTSEMTSYYDEPNFHENSSRACPIEVLVNNMSHLQYGWGQGIIGKVALMGKHCWTHFDNIFSNEFNALIPECPEDWTSQFASGIKTIVLIPVLPHGVLQLGSLEMVAEDLRIISCIEDEFAIYVSMEGAVPPVFNMDTQAQKSPSCHLEKFDESSAASISPQRSEDSTAIDSANTNKVTIFTSDQVVPLVDPHNSFQSTWKDQPKAAGSEKEENIGILPVDLCDISFSVSQSISASALDILDNLPVDFSALDEGLRAYPECSNETVGMYEEFLYRTSNNTYPTRDLVEQKFEDISDAVHNISSFLGFPKDFELLEALGPTFQRQSSEYLSEDMYKNSTYGDSIDGIEPSWSANSHNAECLLQAVVSNIYGQTDDTIPDISYHTRSLMTSAEEFPIFSEPQSARDDSFPFCHFAPAFFGDDKDDFIIETSNSLKSTVSTFIDSRSPYLQSRKGSKRSNISKKRMKPGNNQRLRPKDRQLFQDRIKELRQLVPNGAKCSIDGLLDKAIKHMEYLRGVTNQAEKLRHWVHQEVADRKNIRASEDREGHRNGTWAYEIGNELQICPIVVEDLAYPGHLLIEMICNEHGLFLEIAQVIQSFNLTILKGTMEKSPNNTWAHFIVEASRGFHRLDIFWPLMQLLQRQRNHVSSRI